MQSIVRSRHFWLLLLLGHSLGEQPLGFLGTVLAFPRNLPQECCQFFILTHGSGTEQGLPSSIGKRLVPLGVLYQLVQCGVHRWVYLLMWLVRFTAFGQLCVFDT